MVLPADGAENVQTGGASLPGWVGARGEAQMAGAAEVLPRCRCCRGAGLFVEGSGRVQHGPRF